MHGELLPEIGSCEQTTDTIDLSGKYLTFRLAREEYGLEILKVREIIGLLDITRVPKAPPFIRGVVNLRGKVIPVIELRLKFGMAAQTPTDQTVIIVVQYQLASQERTMGILVDEVLEVLDIDAPQLEPPPAFGSADLDRDFIRGLGKVGSRVVFLLDLARVLSGEEVHLVSRSSSNQTPTRAMRSTPYEKE